MHNLGKNFSLKNFYLFKIGAVRPQGIVRIGIMVIPAVACGRELPQSASLTAPSI